MLRSLDTLRLGMKRPRGVTLVELLVALAIVAVLSTAVAIMLAGAGNTHQFVNNETDAMSNVENAYRRMLHNIRTASSLVSPSNGTLFTPSSGTPLWVTTQVDPSNGNVAANVKYYVDNSNNLVETDTRYASGGSPIVNILVPHVSTFTVQRTNTSPTQLSISISVNAGTEAAVSRSAIVTCRNF